MVTILNTKKSAVFFSVDRTVRRVIPAVAQAHIARYGLAPPVPVKPGEQELIVPVVAHIKKLCVERGAIPIAIDMAPYIESKQLSQNQYLAVLSEFKQLMADFGLPDIKYYMCPHVPKEIRIADPANPTNARFEYKAICDCRFPNNKLIKKACADHNINATVDKYGAFRVWPPSLFVGASKKDASGYYEDEREAAVMRSNMDFMQTECILDGSTEWSSMIGHEHLKAADAIQQSAKRLGRRIGSQVDITKASDTMLPTNF